VNRRAFFGAGAGVGAALVALAVPSAGRATRFRQDGKEWFTNVELQTHEGRTVRFYDDLLKDKIILVNFMFTECGDICPGMTQNLARVQKLLGDRVGRDIFMYSITLQPELDTPELLKAYAETFAVGPGWLFLTGERNDVELLRHRLGFVDSDPVQDADLEQHIGTVRIANVPLHRWMMSPALLEPEAIVRTVMRVIPRRPIAMLPDCLNAKDRNGETEC
jgi:protein SCO1